jgi:MYXO-CTERM domain-containing protein
VVRFVLAFAAVVVPVTAILAPASALAFCRTTTSKAPSGWNPASSGCWTAGVPLFSPMARVPYGVSAAASNQVTLAQATQTADLAFSAWNTAKCDGKSVGIQAYDVGPIDVSVGLEGDALAGWASCTESNACDASAHDVIVFDDTSWPYDDPVNTLALTTVTYGTDDGRIFEAYTEVNSAQHRFSTDDAPDGGSTYDLQTILTHEAGHFLGVAHADNTTAVMYAYYQQGAITLTSDDVDAICTAYPPPSPPAKGCGCAVAGAPSAPAARGAAVLVLFAGLGRMRRRRRSA